MTKTTATMMRMAMSDHTLADGTRLAKGQWVVAPAWAINRSVHSCEKPLEFNALRSAQAREEQGHEFRHQIASPENGYLSFGMGKHAW